MADGNPSTSGSKIEQVAESALLKVLARLVIPPAAIAAISVGSWYLSKQNDALEKLNETVAEGTTINRLIQQRFDLQVKSRDSQITDIYGRINDHEGRLRSLERPRLQ